MGLTQKKTKVETAQKNPSALFEIVTPNMAAEWLRNNPINRKVSAATVDIYAMQIKNGEWQLNGESIKIAEDNTLLDGQHRLSAIVKANIPVKMMVIRNLPKETIKTFDTGRLRSNADNLKIHGFQKDPATVAAAIRLINDFGKDGVYTDWGQRLTPTQALYFLDNNPGIIHSVERIPFGTMRLMPRSISVGLHYMFSQYDRVKADVFFQQLFSGANLDEKSPVLMLRSRLNLTKIGGSRSGRRQILWFCIRAFKAFCDGKTISFLRYDPTAKVMLPWLDKNPESD